MPNTSVLFKLTNILTVCISVYFLSACSVEDPYQTGPSEGQKKESEERASAKKQLIPYKLEIKNNLSEPLANITVKVADQVYQSDPNGVIALNTFTLGNYPIEIEHPDYYFTSLTLNISSNKSNEVIELTPKLNNEVSVIFAGDTMFGRRFMDPSICLLYTSDAADE